MYVDVDGYEGPLDLLLDLARRQKVDLAQISVLALAEQYLGFIETVREKRIEIAADYLVMAAWLAYLKSRLMVPQAPSDDEPTRRDDGGAAAVPAEAPRGDAAGGGAADEPAAARPAGICPRRARADHGARGGRCGKRSLFDLLKAYAIQRERGIPHRLHAARAQRLVAAGSARNPQPADRREHGLGAARRLSRRISDDARAAGDRDRLDLRLEP